MSAAVGRYLAARWPQASLEIIAAGGRLPHLTAPNAVLAVLERALADRSVARGPEPLEAAFVRSTGSRRTPPGQETRCFRAVKRG